MSMVWEPFLAKRCHIHMSEKMAFNDKDGGCHYDYLPQQQESRHDHCQHQINKYK